MTTISGNPHNGAQWREAAKQNPDPSRGKDDGPVFFTPAPPKPDGLPFRPVPIADGLPVMPPPVFDGLPYIPEPSTEGLPFVPQPGIDGLPFVPEPAVDGLPMIPGPVVDGLPVMPYDPPKDAEKFPPANGKEPLDIAKKRLAEDFATRMLENKNLADSGLGE